MGTMLYMARGKATGDQQADRVRETVNRLLRERYKGSRIDMARALGVSGPTLSDLLNRKRGPGMQMLEGLRKLTGESLDQLVYGQPNNTPDDKEGMARSSIVAAARLKGWAEAEEQARRRFVEVPSWAWEAAREAVPPIGSEATVDLAADLAYVAWKHTGDAERRRYEAVAMARASERLRAAPKAKD